MVPSFLSIFWSILWGLILFGSILFLAYVSTKFLGTKISAKMRGKHIKIVDSLALGFDKQIYLIKVGEQFFLASSSNKAINFLIGMDKDSIKISDEDLELLDRQQGPNENMFKNYFEMFKNTSQKNKDVDEYEMPNPDANRFRQNLNKLKGIMLNINSKEDGDEKLNE